MNGKSFTVLCGVTVVAVVGAGVAVYAQRQTQTIPAPAQSTMLPGLAAHPDNVARLQLHTPSFALDMQKKAGGWVDASRGDYPVRTPVVTSLVTSLAALRPLDAKTTNPDLYSRIGVEDFKPGGKSTLVDTADASGTSLGDLILGDHSNALSFDPLGGTFVRLVGDKQSWLVQGAAATPPDFSDWFEDMPNVPGTVVNRVTIVENGKTVFDAKKEGITYHLVAALPAPAPVPAATAPATDQTAAAAPSAVPATGTDPAPAATPVAAPAPAAPAPQANDSVVKRMAQGIVSGAFDDVTPATKVDFTKGRTVRFVTTNGVTFEVQLGTLGGKEDWVSLTPKPNDDATADQAKQAAAMAAKTKGWAYKLPDYRISALTVTLAELTAPPPSTMPAGLMQGGPMQGGPMQQGGPVNLQNLPPELLRQLSPDILRQLQNGAQGGPPAGH